MSLFEELIEIIKTTYKNNNYPFGWRFLGTSKRRIDDNNGIYFVSLNPAGREIPPDHPFESCETGCAYIVETWSNYQKGEAPLQKQIQLLFKAIGSCIGIDYMDVIDNALLGHYIPFRSPSIEELENKNESYILGKMLWTKIIQNKIPKVIICIDKSSFQEINMILFKIGFHETTSKKYDINWGNINIDVKKLFRDKASISIIRFPHPSRFKIFGRPESSNGILSSIKYAFSEYWN